MRIEDRNQGYMGAPLPRFAMSQTGREGEPPRQTQRSSLTPMATDVSEDESPPDYSPRQRRGRALKLFAVVFSPIVVLGFVELLVVGREAIGENSSAIQESMGEAKAFGQGLMAGRSEARLAAPTRDAPISDDEAREVAEVSLDQALAIARITCGDGGMQPTTLWVTTAVGDSGNVVSVTVEGPTHGNPQVATCVGEIAGHIQVPRFRGPPVTAMQEVTIR